MKEIEVETSRKGKKNREKRKVKWKYLEGNSREKKTVTAIKELEEREQKKENEFNNRKKQTENRKHGKG